ncbi:MAG: hypothetical protein AAF153_02870, partial [Pseudomonadota bacterium]
SFFQISPNQLGYSVDPNNTTNNNQLILKQLKIYTTIFLFHNRTIPSAVAKLIIYYAFDYTTSALLALQCLELSDRRITAITNTNITSEFIPLTTTSSSSNRIHKCFSSDSLTSFASEETKETESQDVTAERSFTDTFNRNPQTQSPAYG